MTKTHEARVILDGLAFPEDLRWRDGRLWFSDLEFWIPDSTGKVIAVDVEGKAETIVDHVPGGPPSGLGWLPDGRMLIVATEGRALLVRESDGALTTHADLSAVASFPLNDMVVDASGRAYVGSADVENIPDSAPSELIVVHPDRQTEVADTAIRFPNGTVITPDGRSLVVAESQGSRLLAYTIDGGGSLSGRRVWADTPGMFPDGICLDEEGCVWFADAGGEACVRVAEGGEIRDRIETGQGTFACALGGADGRTLFAATSTFPDSESFDPRPGRILAFSVNVAGTGSP